jgi:APA family basic amino acid/polyamine antiporter
MLSLPLQTWVLAMVWLVIGLGIFFAYSRTHSRLTGRAVPVKAARVA